MQRVLRALAAAAILTVPALADGHNPWPEGAKVYFVTPQDGETVTSPVTVIFGLKGLGVAPAGVEKVKTGHHHLLIDTPMLAGEDLTYSIPADDNHKHFGGGQTETTIELSPGRHTLQLLMGDANHVPHDPPLAAKRITVIVK